MEDLQNLLALAAVPDIGAVRLKILIDAFGSPARVFQAHLSELISLKAITEKIAKDILRNQYQEEAARLLQKVRNSRMEILTMWDQSYPPLLKNIYGAPAILYYCGSFDPRDNSSIACVGTRRPTEYGLSITSTLAKELACLGITIVSGLAVGIDSAAHRGALEGNGRTIAVLGSGLDNLYPRENKSLARKIVNNGVVLSEFPPGTIPNPSNFPQRNRIISGLSLGVIIIEAGKRSGALITAEHALEQNREVFVVPGNITSTKHIGSHGLIKQGAKLVQSIEDILEEIQPHLKDISAQKHEPKPHIPLNPEEQKVMDALSSEPIQIDKLCYKIDLPTHKVLHILLGLELKGAVKSLEGKRYVKI